MNRRNWIQSISLVAISLLLVPTLIAEPGPDKATSPSIHRILTCNILLKLPEHKGTILDWNDVRRGLLTKAVSARNPDIICMQEVGPDQDTNLKKDFPTFTSFGFHDPYVDKNPKRFQLIKNVILFKTDRYDLVSAGTYWLSNTPEIAGSILPGTKLPRHVTWLRLKDKSSGKEFRILDTHLALEHPIRLKELEIIVSETSQYKDQFPQILCGDLNSREQSPEHDILRKASWINTSAVITGDTDRSLLPPDAPPGTSVRPIIDFIYSHGTVKPVATEVIRDHDGDKYPSDHYFVSTDVEF